MAELEDASVEAAVVHLTRWAAQAKTDDAADARVRARWAQQQAEDEATFAEVLVGLAERRAVVALHSSAGSTLRGTVAGVGADYVALVSHAQLTLMALTAIDWIRPEGPAAPAAFGDRAQLRGRLVGVLATLAEEGHTVRMVVSHEAIVGEVVAVGEDVVTLRPAGAHADQLLYVPVASVSEASLRLSG